MDIVIATNNQFCSHAAITIASLIDNNKEENITIYLLTLNCEESNINKIVEFTKKNNVPIFIYKVLDNIFEKFPPAGIYSNAAYLRILVSSLLPSSVKKILYLDCDIIVNGSIKELWNIDITYHSLAAVIDCTLSYNIVRDYLNFDYYNGYINSGVLLINLEYWRKHNIQNKLIEFLNTHTIKIVDQDAINIILHDSIKFIHPKWNCHTGYFAFPPLVPKEQKKYIKSLWKNAIIVHFTGPYKPWYKECVNPYKHIYAKYREITPWKNDKSSYLLNKRYKSLYIIIMRHIKNFVARIISYTY